MRKLNRQVNVDYDTFRKGIEYEKSEIYTNVISGLINGAVLCLIVDFKVSRMNFLSREALANA